MDENPYQPPECSGDPTALSVRRIRWRIIPAAILSFGGTLRFVIEAYYVVFLLVTPSRGSWPKERWVFLASVTVQAVIAAWCIFCGYLVFRGRWKSAILLILTLLVASTVRRTFLNGPYIPPGASSQSGS